MNSILRQINQNNGNKTEKELMQTYVRLIDEELNKMYAKTDCVENYRQYYQKSKDNSRQVYHCGHNSCLFSTNKSSLIVRHIRRHLKQKPYLCPIEGCKQQFYQRCDLRCHLMRHLEDKPFRCDLPECQKTYTSRKALSLHIRSHFPFGFQCEECDKKFTTKWMRNKHLKERHKRSLSPKDQSLPSIKTEDKIRPKTSPIVISKTEPKLESKAIPLQKPNVKSVTNRLIHSINTINDTMRDDLLSNQSIKSISAEFGFEEVIKYVIHSCGQPSISPDIVPVPIETIETIPTVVESDIMSPIESNPEQKCCESNPTGNQSLDNCVENITSLIETYVSNDCHKKVLFKCIHCLSTSDTIESIVGHVFGHISQGVTQSLRNKCIRNRLTIGSHYF